MTASALFAEGGLTLFGLLLVVFVIGLLVGAALGYYTASTDLRREQAKAWDRGAADATVTPLGKPLRNPYRKTSLAPEPPHYVVPNPPASKPPLIFDQDESVEAFTERARAIELRGDD